MSSKRVFICAITLVILCLLTIIILHTQFRFVDYLPSAYTESVRPLNNPYVGWYQIQLYRLSEQKSLDLSYLENREYGPELILLEIDLQNYQEKPLSSSAMAELDALLSACRINGKQVILRFMYDSEGNHPEQEPENITLILTHMSQVSEIINQYTDCVYLIQGLFIGSWGEMHTSDYTNWEDLRRLAHHLSTVTDPSIFLAVRTPEQWRMITGSWVPPFPSQAFDGSLTARLGLFNDGLLGSETDLGTYAESEIAVSIQNSEKHSRAEELDFQNVLCNYVPNGGEVVYDNSYNDLAPALDVLRQTHISYLNKDYDESVLNKWKASIYKSDGLYEGMSGYDCVERHLGYRYVVRSSELTFPYPWQEVAMFAVRIENVGFATAYRPFEIRLVLRNTETGEEFDAGSESDNRLWLPGNAGDCVVPLRIRTYTPGTYELLLQMHDPATGFDISFANESPQTAAGVMLGSFQIRQFPNL